MEPSVLVRTGAFVTSVTGAGCPVGRISRNRRTNCEYKGVSNNGMMKVVEAYSKASI